MKRPVTWFVVGVLVALIAVACSGSEDPASSPDTSSTSTTIPTLSDAATIWCDEQRWQVVGRAAQLGLEIPPTNPSVVQLDALMNDEVGSIDPSLDTGSRLRAELAIARRHLELAEKYGVEWHQSGVHDADWATWRTDSPMDYTRSCAAAYELAGGPSALSDAPPAAQTSDVAASAPSNSSTGGVTTSTRGATTSSKATTTTTLATTTSTRPATTSTLAPGRLVAGTVIACPDFIEATFRNAGGRPVTIVEMVLFIQGGGEPFGYGTDWTPTVEPGATVTWRQTAANLGLDWIGPGLVSVGARPQTSAYEFVYVEGPNPHNSCTAVAPSTTTTAPPVSVLDATDSAATCSTGGIDMTFTIRNTGSTAVELYQVALFPGGPMGHSFLDPDWWPLPTVGPGATVSHRETFSGGSLDTFIPGNELEIHIDSSDGRASTFITCS